MLIAVVSAQHIYRDSLEYLLNKRNFFLLPCRILSLSQFSEYIYGFSSFEHFMTLNVYDLFCAKKWFLRHLKAYPCYLAIWLTDAIRAIKSGYKRKFGAR